MLIAVKKGWQQQYLVLHQDSMLLWYKKQGDSKAQGSVILKVC